MLLTICTELNVLLKKVNKPHLEAIGNKIKKTWRKEKSNNVDYENECKTCFEFKEKKL